MRPSFLAFSYSFLVMRGCFLVVFFVVDMVVYALSADGGDGHGGVG